MAVDVASLMAILYFRGRFENSLVLVNPGLISSICGVASRVSCGNAGGWTASDIARDVTARTACDDAHLFQGIEDWWPSSIRNQWS